VTPPHPADPTTSAGWTRRASLWAICSPLLWALAGCKPEPRPATLPPGNLVLALGDSITFGTGAAAGQDWPQGLAGLTGWQIVNAGIPGDTAQDARSRLGALLDEHRPALVIVELGGNDFLRRRPPAAVKDDLRDLVRQAKASGAAVVLMAVPELSLLAAVASRLSDAPLYADLAEEEGVVLVSDVISKVLSDKALKADAIHPNAQGYRQLAHDLHRQLQQRGLAAQ
jgi:acyl-CoA thioesterase I